MGLPYTVLANNKLWLQIHTASSISLDLDGDLSPDVTVDDPNPTMLEIMGPFTFSITDFDTVTGTYDITITANGAVVVNNATDLASEIDYVLDTGGTITIDDALASIKKHDILNLELAIPAFRRPSRPRGRRQRRLHDNRISYCQWRALRAGDLARPARNRHDQSTRNRTRPRGKYRQLWTGYTGAILFKGTLAPIDNNDGPYLEFE
jgi:hypothetical protein